MEQTTAVLSYEKNEYHQEYIEIEECYTSSPYKMPKFALFSCLTQLINCNKIYIIRFLD